MSDPAERPVARPRHVAIIMDGNGRWAKARGLPRVAGHKQGMEAVRRTVKAAGDLGIETLTLYAFSTENWRRPEDEISDLMGLMRFFLSRELDALHKAGIRVLTIGDLDRFPADIVAEIDKARTKTAGNTAMNLVIALGYGARSEIVGAAQALARRCVDGQCTPDDIDDAMLEAEMQTASLQPLDLLIRTSGEVRLSNFLLWQAAYAEMIFLDMLWPDFGHEPLADCLTEFARRDRRFGGL